MNNLNDLLNRIGDKLQLDKTRRTKTETSYKAVADWLDNESSYFHNIEFDIYPQGSFAINTSVKPYQKEEFDLDFILELKTNHNLIEPNDLLYKLKQTLKQNGVYKDMVEEKSRCIRLNYTNDFHMDILPSCSADLQNDTNSNIKIPEKGLIHWLDSNPKGYAQWFDSKCQERMILEKMAKIDPLPSELPYDLKPILQVATQLIKRYRDVYFESSDYKPRSIVLTTLAALHYDSDYNLYSSISTILEKINNLCKQGKFSLLNPVNSNENFTDRWEKNIIEFNRFKEFIEDFYNSWLELSNDNSQAQTLEKLFGESISHSVLKEASDFRKSMNFPIPNTNITTTSKPWSSS